MSMETLNDVLSLGGKGIYSWNGTVFSPPEVTGFCSQYFARSTHNIPKKNLIINPDPPYL